jgi:hypothetical protein
MDLFVAGESLSVAQLGPDFLILTAPAEHPPGNAEVIVSVDGRKRTWPVYLPQGTAGSLRVALTFRPKPARELGAAESGKGQTLPS